MRKAKIDFWAEDEPAQKLFCPICDREMIEGPTTDRHHLIPKSKKGKETHLVHLVCHRKVHSLFTEKELATKYNTFEALKEHPEVAKFIEWLANKDPEFVIGHRDSNDKKGKRW